MPSRRSAFERYAADSSLTIGGLAAILLQVADPAVARGVVAHSAFTRDPLRRLRHTLGYVYAVSLGTPEQVLRAAGVVDRVHARVPGAVDADRQLWVAATIARLGTQTHELLHRPLDPDLADEIHARAADLGTALQVPAGSWPSDRGAFDRYWERSVAALVVGDDARAIANDLLHPRRAPIWLRAAMPLARTVTSGLLPPAVRDAYGLPWRPRRFAVTVAFLRVLVRLVPRPLRELPARRLLARA